MAQWKINGGISLMYKVDNRTEDILLSTNKTAGKENRE